MSAGLPCLRSRRRRLAWALLPVLALRALIPFGFMPGASDGVLGIEFCPGEGKLPPGISGAAPDAGHLAHHHGHHGTGDPGLPSGAHHAPCLFALSASPAFAPAVAAPAIVPAAATPLAEAPASRLFLPAIIRAQSPRGPPFPAIRS
ncbi:MAG TPA: DUF2946 family protein [Steroidobacteraceae bacterium]|nr:DUF2946 family protein [Steroidobacteraceae bacterium]